MAEPMHARRAVRRDRTPTMVLGVVPGSLRARPELMRSTALQAVFLAVLAVPGTAAVLAVPGTAAAQTMPAATALPTGGKVIAGQASIATTTAPGSASMTVKQTTGYGAYDWKSFDIGSGASVTYQVPTSQAISVNRVISPTSPSIIAGKLSSNGVLVVQNQSGVVFTQGAEVNVNTLIASAPGLSDANARAGKLIFDQPANAGARVENHGTITVAQTGLAALVAPQVANSGVIRANMARVVLAGAEAHTVDLYGDGLLSIDVTKQVTQVPLGADGKAATALVTNSGTILADGGTVLLTASAVDGLVQTLVTAGGQVQANSVGAQVGRVAVTARGGNVTVTGTIAATGVTAGSKGGQIEINAPARSVTVKSGARVDASGRAGGGSIAIGTTLARGGGRTTVKAPTAQFTIIESGARVAADATELGKGGDITLLSSGGATAHWGALSARGGPAGGDGGFIEVSGDSFFLGGSVDTAAPGGTYGTVLLDPTDLVIGTKANKTVTKDSDTFTSADIENGTTLDPADIVGKMTGDIVLATGAGGTLTVASALDVTSNAAIKSVTLKADGNLTVNAAITGGDNITLTNTAGNLTVGAAVSTADGKTITLNSAGSIALNGNVTSKAGIIDLNAGAGGVSQLAGKALVTGTVQSSTGITGSVALTSTANEIGALGDMTVKVGDLSVVNATALAISGIVVLDAGKVASFAVPVFSIAGTLNTGATGTVELAPISGTMSLGVDTAGELTLTPGSLANITAGTLKLGSASAGGVTAGTIALNAALDASGIATTKLVAGAGGVVLNTGPLSAGTLDVISAGGITDKGAAIVATRLLSSGEIKGPVALNVALHGIGSLGDMVVTGGGIALQTGAALEIAGKVQVAGTTSFFSGAVSDKAVAVTGSLSQTVGGQTITLATDTKGGITLTGTVDASPTGVLNLTAGDLGVSQTAGAVTTGVLTSAGGVAASVKLGQATNAITSVGDFAVTGGDFTLASGAAVGVIGAVTADNVTVTGGATLANAVSVSGSVAATAAAGVVTLVAADPDAGGIVLTGAVSAKGTIDLAAGKGGISQTAGSLTAPSLVSTLGISGTASLAMAANAIDSTGAIKVTGGDLILATSSALDIAGTLSVDAGRTISLGLGGIKAMGGALAAVGGTVEIAPLDGKTMSLGTQAATELAVTAAHLTKISGDTLRLGSAAAATTRADSLVVQDSVTAATAVLRLEAGAGGIAFKSGVLSATTLDLNASGGGVTAAAGATVSAARLQSATGITGDVLLANSVHAIATLDTLAVTDGSLALNTGKALSVTGKVSATAIALDSSAAAAGAIDVSTGSLAATAGGSVGLTASNAAGGIALAGSVDTAGTLTLLAGTGGIVQSAGTLAAGTLAAKTTAGLALAAADNRFATIGDATAAGSASIASATATKLTGTLAAADVTWSSSADSATAISVAGSIKTAGTASLSATKGGGGIALSGTVDATTGIVLSAGAGGVTQSGGALITGALSSAGSGGAVALTAADNKVDALGAFAVTGKGGFALTTGTGLATTGAVSTTAGDIALRATAPASAISLGSNVTATGGTLDLSAGTGGVVQTAGTVTAAVLASSAGIAGPVTLELPGNAIAAIGALNVTGGGLSLVNATALGVTGPLAVTGGGLVLDVTDNAGKGGLQIAGAVSGDAVTLIGRGTSGAIGIGGTVTTAGILDVSVTGAGGVTAGGTLAVDVLRSTSGVVGGLVATNAANSIGTLDALAVTGGNLAIGTKAGAGLTINGAVTVEAGKSIQLVADGLSMTGTGALAASAGTVDIRTRTVGIGLGAGAPGELALPQASVDAITTGTLALTASGAGITLRDSLDTKAKVASLLLVADTGIALTKGTLSAATLQASAAAGGLTQAVDGFLAADALSTVPVGLTGPVSLANAGNSISKLGPITATGTVAVTSASAMDVTDAIKAPGIALVGGAAAGTALSVAGTGTLALTGAGTIALGATNTTATTVLAGDVNAGAGGVLLLTGGGALDQTAGIVTAGTVTTAGAIAAASLAQAGNKIGVLADATVLGSLALTTTQALTTVGTISVGSAALTSNAGSAGAITLAAKSTLSVAPGGSAALAATDAAGGIALAGTLSAPGGGLDLRAGSGGVVQSAGTITAGVLTSTGDIGGAATLTQANAIAGLGALKVGGTLALVSGSSVDVSGPVAATGMTLTAAGMTFSGAGAMSAPGGTIEIGPLAAGTAFRLGSTVPPTAFNLGDLKNVTASMLRIGQAAGGAKAASIALDGVVDPGVATLDLISAGAITQGVGGLDVPLLTATAASLDLNQGGNTIGALGALAIDGLLAVATDGTLAVNSTLSAASISLRSFDAAANALSIGGTLSAAANGTIALQADNGGIALAGKLDATPSGTIALVAGGGGIAQSAGSMTAALLQGSSQGTVTLDQTGNAVTTLGSFAAPAVDLTLRSAGTLDIAGPVSAANATIRGAALKLSGDLAVSDSALLASTSPTGGIVLAGTAGVTNTLTLTAGLGGVQQSAGGITVGALTGTSSGAVALGQPVNSIGTLAAFSVVGGALDLVSATKLTVSGAVLASAAIIVVAAADAKAIDVTGTITTTGGPVALSAANGGIALSGTLSATTTGTIDLLAGINGINQSGGAMTAGRLQGKSSGAVTLTSGTNAVSKLGDFAVDTTMLLTGSVGLDVAGAVKANSATIAAPAVTLSGSLVTAGAAALEAAGAMTLSGTVDAGSLALGAGVGGINQSGGAIIAPSLSVNVVGGGAALNQATNAVDSLAAATLTGGALSLTTSKALALPGAVLADSITLTGNATGTAIDLAGSLSTNAAGTIALATKAGAIRLAGDVAAVGGTVDLFALGNVDQVSGSISTGTLRSTGGIGGDLSLGSNSNAIAKIDGLAVAGAALIKDSVALDIFGKLSGNSVTVASTATGTAITVSGTASATTKMTLAASAPDGGIALSGTLKAATLDLSAGTGGISQPSGSISATTLQSASGSKGDVALGQAANAIGQLGAFDASGKMFTLKDSSALTVAGPLTASSVTLASSAASAKALDVTGSLTTGNLFLTASNAGGGIALSGDLVSAGVAQFTAGSGGIVQSAGSYKANVLAASATGGSVVLTQLGNSVNDLIGGAVTGGDFSLTSSSFFSAGGVVADNVTLTALSGGITTKLSGIATNAAGTILLDTAGGIAFEGPVNAKTGGTVDLRVAVGNITQTGAGIITAGTLTSTGTIDGTVALATANNNIGTIASLAATGSVGLRDTAALTIATLLSGASIDVTNTSADPSAFTLAGGAKILAGAGGAITLNVTGGATFAGTLDATTSGKAVLSAGGALTQTGGTIAAGELGLIAGTNMTLAGTLDATTTGKAVLSAGGALTQTGGTIAAGELGLIAGTDLTLAGTLDATTTGKAVLTAGGALTQTSGTITAADLSLTAGTAMALAGTLDATSIGTMVLKAGGTLSQTAGAITAGTLDLTSIGGAVTQTGGTIAAATLRSSGSIAGPVTLDQAGNAIATLGAMTVSGGGLTLVDSKALTIAGALTAGGDVTITSTGAGAGAIAVGAKIAAAGKTVALVASAADSGITLGADITAATLSLAAGTAGVVQTAGTLALTTLASPGIAGAASIDLVGNSIGNIGTFFAAGDIALRDGSALVVAGPLQSTGGGIALSVEAFGAPALTVSGTITSAAGKATTLAANGAIVVDGQVNAPGGQVVLATNDRLTITGQVNVPGGSLSLATVNGVTATGNLAASTLAVSASAPSNVSLTGSNNIGTLSSATVSGTTPTVGTFELKNAGPLTITGTVKARIAAITAAGSLKVADGASIVTDGRTRAEQKLTVVLNDADIANFPTVDAGSFLKVTSIGGAPGKIDVGSVSIAPLNVAQATFDLILPNVPGGTITLGQLKAPTTDLILVSRFGGSATGTMDVAGLLVLGGGGKADLFGKVGGLEGQAAANKASIWPQPSSDYRFNACPITSINCVLLPVQTIPPISPVRDVPIIRDRPSQDDTDVQLPNVSDEDY